MPTIDPLRPKDRHVPVRIALGYAALSAAWVLAGDLALLRNSPDALPSITKGLLFVVLSSIFIYLTVAASVRRLQQARRDIIETYDATLIALIAALDLRDQETGHHSSRVVAGADALAAHLGMSPQDRVHLRRGALLHDIGKIGVPDRVLQKKGPLTPREREMIQQHPTYALEMLAGIEFLRPAISIPVCHHEKWDGTGYPRGLAGEAIPLPARIFAVVDVYDALTSDRVYRAAWSREDTLTHIENNAGTHFEPRIVAAFVALMLTHPRET